MKDICVLGSTGSIGTQTLDIAAAYPDSLRVEAMSCGRNTELFREQLRRFKPRLAAAALEEDALELSREFPDIQFYSGIDGISRMARESESSIVVNSLLGMIGIRPTYEALLAGKDIAFANKETLVAAGEIIMSAVKEKGAAFLPVDSEHSAIFQCLQGAAGNPVRKLILTASGGPFRGYSQGQLESVSPAQALRHPNWSMGAKITIDSATMMNKGLEIIEASWLFGIPAEDIEVVVHPQSAVHSAVEFMDGAVIAQIGSPDMKIPIAYALSYPKRLPEAGRPFSFTELGSMTFEKPDHETFRCLALAYEAIARGGSCPAVMNAANEAAVAAFLSERIGFTDIPRIVESCMDADPCEAADSIDAILEKERLTRERAERIIEEAGR
ncbi:MAG: 1-deoxy-D-xylulose-5-phosphate reductoisomerase [Firmicutes bacterium]|nr:1-deoxy-D-xylulose-5-phosphate reductoisomerase [Bacillota bacterium]